MSRVHWFVCGATAIAIAVAAIVAVLVALPGPAPAPVPLGPPITVKITDLYDQTDDYYGKTLQLRVWVNNVSITPPAMTLFFESRSVRGQRPIEIIRCEFHNADEIRDYSPGDPVKVCGRYQGFVNGVPTLTDCIIVP